MSNREADIANSIDISCGDDVPMELNDHSNTNISPSSESESTLVTENGILTDRIDQQAIELKELKASLESISVLTVEARSVLCRDN